MLFWHESKKLWSSADGALVNVTQAEPGCGRGAWDGNPLCVFELLCCGLSHLLEIVLRGDFDLEELVFEFDFPAILAVACST